MRFKLWIEISEYKGGAVEPTNIAPSLPESIEVEFKILESAERFRDYLLEHAYAVSRYIVDEYCRHQEPITPFVYNRGELPVEPVIEFVSDVNTGEVME